MKLKQLTATTALALVAAASAQAETTLNILMIEGLDKGAMEAVAEEYMDANPEVTVEIQALPWGQFFQVSELRMRSGDESIDLIYTDAPVIASYAANGYLEPFPEEIAARAQSALVSTAIEAGTFESNLFALPMNSSAQVLFYNVDLLEEAGVTPPMGLRPGSETTAADIEALATDARWTWEDLRNAARAVTKSEAGRTETWGFSFEQGRGAERNSIPS